MEKQDELIKDNIELKKIYKEYQSAQKENNEIKHSVEELKKENETLKLKCSDYERIISDISEKVESNQEKVHGAITTDNLKELRNDWKKECVAEKVSFNEIVKQQIQDKTTDTVIKIIKEKSDFVRDTADKKKCLIIFGIHEKKNPVKFDREKEEKMIARSVITVVQDQGQELDKEIEEVHRMGKYSEGGKRPLKVKMRSQAAVEEILARTGKLAAHEESRDIWIKRDLNLEEREKERNLRSEAKEKNEQRTETEKKIFFWRVMDMRLRKWYLKEKTEEVVANGEIEAEKH